MQRGMVRLVDMLNESKTEMRVRAQADYINEVGRTRLVVQVVVPIDASVDSIRDSLITQTVADQPPEFNLQKQDIIITSLERG
jgi:hypothetical protein